MAKFCSNCGAELNDNQDVCIKCGVSIQKPQSESNPEAKSKTLAGLLGLFFGTLGVHNFYLGYNSKAVGQLLLTLVGWIAFGLGPLIAFIWSLVEAIQIFTGSINKDAKGNKLKD